MKSIIVDFSKIYIGTIAKQGEHNRAQLVFALPDDFAGADYVNAEFKKSDNSDVVMEGLIPKDGFITIPLTQGLTNVCDQIDIQLVAYTVNGVEITEIAKSLTVCGVIRPSLNILFNHDEPGIIERVIAFINAWSEKLSEMWNAKHNHENRTLLDSITPEMLGGEQADWDENDPEEVSYVKNRTHWHEEEEVTTDYTVNWVGTTPTYQAQPWAADDLGITLNEGETYTLQAAGATITDVCQKFTMTTDQGLTQDYYYIGNLHIYDPSAEDNDFPMLLAMDKMRENGEIIRTWNIVLTYDTLFGSNLSFSLGKTVAAYHPLSMDYMPDSVKDAVEVRHNHDNLEALDDMTVQTLTDVAANTAARHSHSNQQLLNQIGVATMISGTMPMAISYNNIPMDGWSTVFTNGANVSDILYANVRLVCSTPLESLSINALSNPISIRVPEYLIEFTTGATAPTVTLPSSIIWANELTVEPNKHYQISILNNIALWCAVDVEEEEA